MKILHIIPAYPPSEGYGGAPMVAFEICTRLAVRDHEVYVYTTDANDRQTRLVKTSQEKGSNLEINRFRNISNFLAFRYRLCISPSMILKGVRIKNFDVVHIHDFRTFQSIIGYLYCKLFGVPYVLQPHGKPPIQHEYRGKKLKSFFDILIGKRILNGAGRLLVLNDDEFKIYYSNYGINESEIIPNGIDILKYSQLPIKGSFRFKNDIRTDDKLILYVGRLHESKGLELLIQAYSNVCKYYKNSKLVIAGQDDGHQKHLEKMAHSYDIDGNVLFTGFLTREQKIAAYVDADVFATPTFYGFPLTFLEAMVCGLPIVTTNYGDSIAEIESVGYVTDYDSQEYSKALLKILGDKMLKKQLQDNAARIVNKYDWNEIVSQIEMVYLSVVEKK